MTLLKYHLEKNTTAVSAPLCARLLWLCLTDCCCRCCLCWCEQCKVLFARCSADLRHSGWKKAAVRCTFNSRCRQLLCVATSSHSWVFTAFRFGCFTRCFNDDDSPNKQHAILHLVINKGVANAQVLCSFQMRWLYILFFFFLVLFWCMFPLYLFPSFFFPFPKYVSFFFLCCTSLSSLALPHG